MVLRTPWAYGLLQDAPATTTNPKLNVPSLLPIINPEKPTRDITHCTSGASNLTSRYPDPVYEDPKILSEYLLFHYGTAEEILPGNEGPRDALFFPVRSVTELLPPDQAQVNRALDVGCAVGRSAFELARVAGKVHAVDFSRAFIEAAQGVAAERAISFSYAVEGEITQPSTARVPEGIDPHRIEFRVGDAMNLPVEWSNFDVVHAANLICRLPEPRRFLDRLPDLVAPGGTLLLCTPWSWLETFTPRDKWLGGHAGGPHSFDALQEILSPYFELEFRKDLPFLIREHARKYQWSLADGTRWRRVAGKADGPPSTPIH